MRFLITGGAGFIGSHLADELLPLAEPGSAGTVLIVQGKDAAAARWLTLVAVGNAEAEGRDPPLVLDRPGWLGARPGARRAPARLDAPHDRQVARTGRLTPSG